MTKRLPVVAITKFALLNHDVDDACNPSWNQIGVEVEFTDTPKLLLGVYGNAKVLAAVR